MSHGNVTTHIGTCRTCLRECVELHISRRPDPRTGDRGGVCVDEFACFAAWSCLQPKRPKRPDA